MSTGELLEVKCPAVRRIVPGYQPQHYILGQVQYGIHCLRDFSVRRCYFTEYKPAVTEAFPETEQVSVTPIDADPDWECRYKWIIDEFWEEVLQYRRDGIVPEHYASDARYDVWLNNRRREDPLKFPPSKLTLKREKNRALARTRESEPKRAKRGDIESAASSVQW